MADPATMMLASTGISAIGSLTQAKAQSTAAEYNAQQSMFNASVAQRNADTILKQGDAEAYRQGIEAQKQIGKMRAMYGASGVAVDAGSPLDILAESTRAAALDQHITRYNYAMRAQQMRQQAGSFAASASLEGNSARSSLAAGYLTSAGQTVSGVTRAMGMATGGGLKLPFWG